jgi:transcription elongation factor GreA
MDIDDGHISLASPLGRALGGSRVGDEVSLRLPAGARRLRIVSLITVHQAEPPEPARDGSRKRARRNGKR